VNQTAIVESQPDESTVICLKEGVRCGVQTAQKYGGSQAAQKGPNCVGTDRTVIRGA